MGFFPVTFPFFFKKRKTTRCRFERHDAAASSPANAETGEKKAFKIFFPLTFSPSHLHQTLPKPIPISPCRHDEENQETHASATMPCKQLPSPTLPYAMVGVRWSFPPPLLINTKWGTSKGGWFLVRKRGTNRGILRVEGEWKNKKKKPKPKPIEK